MLEEEQQAHALPNAQWAVLEECLQTGASISRTSQVMREICDAVDHEVTKEVRSIDQSRLINPAPLPHAGAALMQQPASLWPPPV